jgi:plasmid stabilization system protein ParE
MSGFDLSRRARGELVEIGVYGADRWGDQRSELYVSEFYTVFQWLVEGRSIGALISENRKARGRSSVSFHERAAEEPPP